jgi:hypothetical protein
MNKERGISDFFNYLQGHHLLATAMALVLSYKIFSISELFSNAVCENDVSNLKKIKKEVLEFFIASAIIFLLFKVIKVNKIK